MAEGDTAALAVAVKADAITTTLRDTVAIFLDHARVPKDAGCFAKYSDGPAKAIS
jgi:hypothetical protein